MSIKVKHILRALHCRHIGGRYIAWCHGQASKHMGSCIWVPAPGQSIRPVTWYGPACAYLGCIDDAPGLG